MEEKTLTRNHICKATKAPAWLIVYLKDCGRLPIVQESKGRGFPTLYHPDAIKVIKEHLAKSKRGE